tara:strand:- start:10657 stop:11340 length:684 start_codon:yes stop_codon:yes gene_type:complete
MTHILNETFDAVYVLNLDRRADRWEECKEIAHSCGLTLDRLSGIDGAKLKEEEVALGMGRYIPKGDIRGAQGCALSHYAAVKKAQEERRKSVLIFEDDFEFVDNFENLFAEYYKQVPVDWEFLYLGANHNTHALSPGGPITLPLISKNVGKPLRSYCLHAYSIKESLYDYILSLFDVEVTQAPVDVTISQVQPSMKTCYAFSPSLVTQRDGYSDIGRKEVSYKPYIL